MAPKKLSESEKKEIVQLYGHPEESTSTLASRFGVSSSTISRVLKQGLSDDEYNNLVQQKRTGSQSVQPPQLKGKQRSVEQADGVGAGEPDSQSPDKDEPAANISTQKPRPKTKSSRAKSQESSDETSQKEPLSDDDSGQADSGSALETTIGKDTHSDEGDPSREPVRRRRRRSRAPEPDHPDDDVIQLPLTQLTDSSRDDDSDEDEFGEDESDLSYGESNGTGDRPSDPVATHTQNYPQDDEAAFDDDEEDDDAFVEALDDDLLDEEDDDFSDDLDDDLDDDEEFSDGDGASDGDAFEPLHFRHEDLVQIYPFADADLPRTCYLVIDRSAELITRPLQEFGELGDLPSAELSENTLPVFDNHRVAKRFANRRTQRIVKIPDSRILRKTMPYLQSKGITRLLIDGHVYSLTE